MGDLDDKLVSEVNHRRPKSFVSSLVRERR